MTSGSPAELGHPVVVAEHQDRCRSRLVLALPEGPPQMRGHPEHVEEVGRDHAGLDPAGLTIAEQDEGHGVVLDDALEGTALGPIVGQLGHGETGILHAGE